MRYATLRTFALSLPEVAEAPHHDYGSFRVRGRIFVTVPPHRQHVHVFVGDDERDQALVMYPQFCERLLWGAKVVGLRVHLAAAETAAVKALVRQAWAYKAQATPAARRRRAATPPARRRLAV